MLISRKPIILITVSLVLVLTYFSLFIYEEEQKIEGLSRKNELFITSEEGKGADQEFIWYSIPEMNIEFQIPKEFENHLSYRYEKRKDSSWLKYSELNQTARDAGLERCISRGEVVMEAHLIFDKPLFYGDDVHNSSEIGNITLLKKIDSDDCGNGKIASGSFVPLYDGRLIRYVSLANNQGGFWYNKELEPKLKPLFYILSGLINNSIRKPYEQ